MPQKKVLVILTIDRLVNGYLVDSLASVLGDEVDIRGYCIDSGETDTYYADLVVTSTEAVLPYAHGLFPDTPIIYGQRGITGYNLEQVLAAPHGQRAMVISRYRKTAEELIESLLSLGVDHLEYEAGWLGKTMDLTNIDLMITPGMMHLCPPSNIPVIDVGRRLFSIMTIAEILQHLSLNMKYLQTFEASYAHMYTNTSQKIKMLLDESEHLRHQQEMILQEIDEGILMVDEKHRPVLSSPVVRKLFGSIEEMPQNAELAKIYATADQLSCAQSDGGYETGTPPFVVEHKTNQRLQCQRRMMRVGGAKHYIYTFRNLRAPQPLSVAPPKAPKQSSFSARHTFEQLWGYEGDALLQRAAAFAKTEHSVLIIGESGTGKELFAQAIHNASLRASGPFVAVNFAAISQSLMESELFGYTEGAFTGAKKSGKKGFFELANGGTIFLDEIGDAPLHIQPLLLRVLEEQQITRVGGEEQISINVRVIAATNQPLSERIKAGSFRGDLFFRLNVLSLHTRPLRAMRAQIPTFFQRYQHAGGQSVQPVSPALFYALRNYDWPGNFRELKSLVEYLGIACAAQKTITPDALPDYLLDQLRAEDSPDANDWNDALLLLQREPVLCAVLDCFRQSNPHSLGRNHLIHQMAQQRSNFSESEAKRALTRLGTAGLIEPGTTRQGTRITEKGLFILSLEKQKA